MAKSRNSESDSNTEEHSNNSQPIAKSLSWKQKMRIQSKRVNQTLTKPIIIQHQTKTKNACKNISKAIIQFIQNTDIAHRIGARKDFLGFVKKNRQIQNLQMLVKMISPSKNPDLNDNRCSFRKIYHYFIKTQFPAYIFNSKIKEKSSHLEYRQLFLSMLQNI